MTFQFMPKNFDLLADEVGLAKPEVRRRIIKTCEEVLSSLSMIEIINPLQEEVRKFIEIRCMHIAKHMQLKTR